MAMDVDDDSDEGNDNDDEDNSNDDDESNLWNRLESLLLACYPTFFIFSYFLNILIFFNLSLWYYIYLVFYEVVTVVLRTNLI